MVTKNKALWIAATDVMEIVDRLGAALTPELREEHKFAIEVARAIEKGFLSGNGTPGIIRTLGAAYTELSVAHWEHCEELRKANTALKARQAAEKEALREQQAGERDELGDVLALYKVGQELTVRYERWAVPRAATVAKRTWRAAGTLPAAWVYDLKTDDGTYTWAETDTDWDVDVA